MKLLDKIAREERHPEQLPNYPRFTFASPEPSCRRGQREP